MAAPKEGESRLSLALLSTPSTSDATQSRGLRQRYPRVPGEHGTCGHRAGSHTQEAVEEGHGAPGRRLAQLKRPRHLIQCLGGVPG